MKSMRWASAAVQPVTRSNSRLSRSTRVSGVNIVIMAGIVSMIVCSSSRSWSSACSARTRAVTSTTLAVVPVTRPRPSRIGL